MSASPAGSNAVPGAGRAAAESLGPRVWQACLPCRRKKVRKLRTAIEPCDGMRCGALTLLFESSFFERQQVKCDGKQPCHNCSSRDHSCDYPGSHDKASVSRQYVLRSHRGKSIRRAKSLSSHPSLAMALPSRPDATRWTLSARDWKVWSASSPIRSIQFGRKSMPTRHKRT